MNYTMNQEAGRAQKGGRNRFAENRSESLARANNSRHYEDIGSHCV